MYVAYYNTMLYMFDLKKIPHVTRRIAKDSNKSCDGQFSAFSTKVLDQMNRKHNRNSSPFTTLADRTERKVVSTGAGQPNY